jgi:glyoxylase-like metal-dependent hydrolase (beta-lactamase superfamily II)
MDYRSAAFGCWSREPVVTSTLDDLEERMKRAVVLLAIVGSGAAAMGIAACTQQAPSEQAPAAQPAGAPAQGQAAGGGGGGAANPPTINLQLEKVRNNLYQLPIFNQSNAPGATTTIFVTESNGVVLVDTKNPGSGKAIIENVRKITDKPITTIINTHTHNDHLGGNLEFEPQVEVIVQENTVGYMKGLAQYKDGQNADRLPKRTFKDKLTLFSGNDAIDLYHFGPAHTGGDAFVVFRNLRVMATGDVIPATGTPVMDLANGGSALQWGATIAKAAAAIKGVDLITRGHTSQTCDWACFVEYGEYMTAYAEAARAAHKAGKTVEQAIADIPTAMGPRWKDYFAGLSGRNPGTKANVTAFYEELNRK